MNISPVRTAIRQFGVWITLLLVTGLFTLLFSVLGTITTSALTGIIMGASRRWRWQLVPYSLVFPLVGMALTQAASADLALRLRLATGALFLGTFWVTYLVGFFVMYLEKGSAASGTALSHGTISSMPATNNVAAAVANTAIPLTLPDLQGTWLSEAGASDGSHLTRLIAIAEDRFTVSIVNSGGAQRVVARGCVRVEGASAQTLRICCAQGCPADAPR